MNEAEYTATVQRLLDGFASNLTGSEPPQAIVAATISLLEHVISRQPDIVQRLVSKSLIESVRAFRRRLRAHNEVIPVRWALKVLTPNLKNGKQKEAHNG